MLAGVPRSTFFDEYCGDEIDDFVAFMCFRCTDFHIFSSSDKIPLIPSVVDRYAVAQVACAVGFAFLRGVQTYRLKMSQIIK